MTEQPVPFYFIALELLSGARGTSCDSPKKWGVDGQDWCGRTQTFNMPALTEVRA